MRPSLKSLLLKLSALIQSNIDNYFCIKCKTEKVLFVLKLKLKKIFFFNYYLNKYALFWSITFCYFRANITIPSLWNFCGFNKKRKKKGCNKWFMRSTRTDRPGWLKIWAVRQIHWNVPFKFFRLFSTAKDIDGLALWRQETIRFLVANPARFFVSSLLSSR